MPSLSDVSAQLMTALFQPASGVLTVMNIFPRRRRSARVTKKLPLNHGQVDIAATTPTRNAQPCSIRHVPWGLLPNLPERTGQRYDKNKAPRGWVTANESVTSFLPPQITNKRRKLRRLIKRLPRVLPSRRTGRTTARPPRCYPRTYSHHIISTGYLQCQEASAITSQCQEARGDTS